MLKTVQKHYVSQIEIKKSRFLSCLIPMTDFESELQSLKTRYPKANHHIYAWRQLNEFRQIVENQSDDGEPKGSSGKPTLSVLAGNKVVNAAVITSRWFGGIKLGVGGLVRAYSESAKMVLALAEFAPIIHRKKVAIKVTYPEFSRFEYLLQSFDIQGLPEKHFHSDHVLVICFIAETELTRFEALFTEISGVSLIEDEAT